MTRILDWLLGRLGIPPAGPRWDAYLASLIAETEAESTGGVEWQG